MTKVLTLNLLSYTDSVEVHNFVGTEVGISMDHMVGSTADNINGFLDVFLCDHESPVDHNVADPSVNNE